MGQVYYTFTIVIHDEYNYCTCWVHSLSRMQAGWVQHRTQRSSVLMIDQNIGQFYYIFPSTARSTLLISQNALYSHSHDCP